jgi:squalene-associated FAD-dependent desaturase
MSGDNTGGSIATEAKPRVAIIGGGLAGLAAAVALSGQHLNIELFESRRQLGGRAASFRDPATGELIDHCQHVSLGCCTNLADFCRRTGLAPFFRRDRVLHFFSAEGRRYDFAATRWLPAPLHLAPAFLRMGYLSLGERLGIARAIGRLARLDVAALNPQPTIGEWLRQQRQSPRAIEQFWSVVLVSALGESVDRAALEPARKVFVDGFCAAKEAYEIEVPTVPLSELYGQRLADWLTARGVALKLGASVQGLEGDSSRVSHVVLDDGTREAFDAVIVAVPWRRVRELFSLPTSPVLDCLEGVEKIQAAPITGVHLWFDRPITPLPHAVLVGMLSQWVFARGQEQNGDTASQAGYYYQVVISASRQLAGRDRDEVIGEICDDLRRVFPAAKEARLLRSRLVTEQAAVFSVQPGIERLRPAQRTAIRNLALAGDWTATGWPATMEGAVRSGYLAAEVIAAELGEPTKYLVSDLPRGFVAKLLIRGK